uniref:Glycosyltransferase n=1 Tax=Leersia perrieri TaxID=77586 RepID=A0A0D9XRQ5_9ORYZ
MALVVKPHVVIVPYPCSGNINRAMQLAKLLHGQGVFVTFVNTEHNHLRLTGLRSEPNHLNQPAMRGTLERAPVTAEGWRRGDDEGVLPPVTCVVPTFLMSFALDVAKELGIPTMVLWGCSAAALMGHMWLGQLRESGYFPIKDAAELETIIDWIPGMPPIQLGEISGFLRKTEDPDNFGLRFNEIETKNCAKADALILNTFDDLEADVLAALRANYPRIYTIGPIGSLHHHLKDEIDDDASTGSNSSLSLWRQDTECLAWLDKQEPGTVVYVSFGSHAVLTLEQVMEIAWGLVLTGRPFLWAIRENQISGGADGCLPAEPFMEAASQSYITTWCVQEQVLFHHAVGCFVAHNGWNSTCESIAAGVPMVCWPGFADQYTNCKYACKEWGVGMQLDQMVRREQVASHIMLVMELEEKKKCAAGWKAKAEMAVRPGGSSYRNLSSMVGALIKSSQAELQTEPEPLCEIRNI